MARIGAKLSARKVADDRWNGLHLRAGHNLSQLDNDDVGEIDPTAGPVDSTTTWPTCSYGAYLWQPHVCL